MNTIAAVLAFLATFTPSQTPVTSTELLCEGPVVDASAGFDGSKGVKGFDTLAVGSVVAGALVYMNAQGDDRHKAPVPEPGPLLAVAVGCMGLMRRKGRRA